MLQKKSLKLGILFSLVSVSCVTNEHEPARLQFITGAPCPSDMIHIHGEFCSDAEFTCEEELPSVTSAVRCKRFSTTLKGCDKRVNRSFCIDRSEWRDLDLPRNYVTYVEAEKLCRSVGKRICEEREWISACEGVDPRPYPTGFTRPSESCNIDHGERCGEELCYRIEQPHASCASQFGVLDMVGNVDEWVHITPRNVTIGDKTYRIFSGLKGGHWGPVRNRCRPVTDHHFEWYAGIQTGFRCCKDDFQ